MHERAQHVRRIAHAFLVGEGRDRDGPGRAETRRPQRLDDGQAGQHAVAAVIDAGIDDGVDMRADQDGSGPGNAVRRIAGLPIIAMPKPEQVADLVDFNGQARLAHPAHDQIPPGAIGVGGGKPGQHAIDAPGVTKAGQTVEQAGGVDRGGHGGLWIVIAGKSGSGDQTKNISKRAGCRLSSLCA